MFNENSIYWILGVTLIGLLITLSGFITGRGLPVKQRRLRTQKYAAVALGLLAFSFPIFKPFVSSHSRTKYLDELKAENLDSLEDIAKFDKEQTKNIERLKIEVEDLRKDLNALSDYYGFVIQLFSSALGALSVGLYLRKAKEEKGFEEIQSDQISKL